MTYCMNCGLSSLYTDSALGQVICTSCGVIHGENITVSSLNFTEQNNGSTSLTGQMIHLQGRTVIPQESPSDIVPSLFDLYNPVFNSLRPDISLAPTPLSTQKSNITKEKQTSRYFNITSHSNHLETIERYIQNILQITCLPSSYSSQAFRWYKLMSARNLTKGKNIVYTLTACLYLVARLEKNACLIIDLASSLKLDCAGVGRVFSVIVKCLGVNVPMVDPCLYIDNYVALLMKKSDDEVCDSESDSDYNKDFNFDVKFDLKNEKVLNKQAYIKEWIFCSNRIVSWMKRDWIVTGRRPNNVCGAAILVANRILYKKYSTNLNNNNFDTTNSNNNNFDTTNSNSNNFDPTNSNNNFDSMNSNNSNDFDNCIGNNFKGNNSNNLDSTKNSNNFDTTNNNNNNFKSTNSNNNNDFNNNNGNNIDSTNNNYNNSNNINNFNNSNNNNEFDNSINNKEFDNSTNCNIKAYENLVSNLNSTNTNNNHNGNLNDNSSVNIENISNSEIKNNTDDLDNNTRRCSENENTKRKKIKKGPKKTNKNNLIEEKNENNNKHELNDCTKDSYDPIEELDKIDRKENIDNDKKIRKTSIKKTNKKNNSKKQEDTEDNIIQNGVIKKRNDNIKKREKTEKNNINTYMNNFSTENTGKKGFKVPLFDIEDIARVVKGGVSTINMRLKEIGDTETAEMTVDDFMKIWIEREEDPPVCKSKIKLMTQNMEQEIFKNVGEKNVPRKIRWEMIKEYAMKMKENESVGKEDEMENVFDEDEEFLDDSEIESFLLDEEETKKREEIWEEMYGEFMREKEEKIKVRVVKKKEKIKENNKEKDQVKKKSNKLNYNILDSLFN